jgi:penicillin-binding protein 1A
MQQTSTPSSPPPAPRKRRRPLWLTLIFGFVGLIFAGIVCVALVLGYALVVATPNLPSLEALTDYQPKVPLRIYTADHVLIGEFGEERRDIVHMRDVPDNLKKAVLAIEDARFYDHGGVDLTGIARAGFVALTNGHATQGASTITMQVARNFFCRAKRRTRARCTKCCSRTRSNRSCRRIRFSRST